MYLPKDKNISRLLNPKIKADLDYVNFWLES